MSVRNTLFACLAAAILGAALTIAVQALPRESSLMVRNVSGKPVEILECELSFLKHDQRYAPVTLPDGRGFRMGFRRDLPSDPAVTLRYRFGEREYRFSRWFRVGDRSTLAIEIDGASLQVGHCDSSRWRVGCSFRADQVTEGVVSSNR